MKPEKYETIRKRVVELWPDHTWKQITAILREEFDEVKSPEGWRKWSGNNYIELPPKNAKPAPKTIEAQIKEQNLKFDATQDKKARDELLQRAAVADRLIGSFKEAIRPVDFTPSKIAIPEVSRADTEEAGLIISDTQAGRKTKTYNC